MRVLHILAMTAACGLAACKQQPPADNTRVIDPAPNTMPTTVPNTNTEVANTAENKPVHDEANHPAEPAATKPAVAVGADGVPKDKVVGAAEVDNGELTAEEAVAYHKTCHFILEKMVKCAKDPGFKKYQARWTSKGAPAAGAKGYEKRLLTWNAEQGRNESCKTWSRRPGTRAHFLSTGKLGTLREDAKLTCEFFGQELDDDGWFPGALTEI